MAEEARLNNKTGVLPNILGNTDFDTFKTLPAGQVYGIDEPLTAADVPCFLDGSKIDTSVYTGNAIKDMPTTQSFIEFLSGIDNRLCLTIFMADWDESCKQIEDDF